MVNKNISKKEYISFGILGCLLGILCFILIYGISVLDFTYDGWLLNEGMDLKQHYVGWCHFRNTPWKFPIGLIDSLSEPFSMSVVYTDSIPLFAVIFKLFRNVLPEHFQYFGLFGIICFAMQGALSSILIRLFTDKKQVCAMGSIFFIVSTPMLQRMFFHTALSAQWLILLAIIMWFKFDLNKDVVRNIVIFALFGMLCISIHSYYMFMCGIIFVLFVIENYIRSVRGDFDDKSCSLACCDVRIRKRKAIINGLSAIGSFCIFAFMTLYVLGGFYGVSSVSGAGFGVFNANMTALINPFEYGGLIKGMELYDYFQYEGAAYLGLGVIFLLVALCIAGIIYLCKNSDKFDFKKYAKAIKEYAYVHYRKTLIFIGIIFSCFIAMFPNFDFADIKIVHIPLPGILIKILGICRTNGRFMWIAWYLIVLSVIVLIAPHFEKSAFKLILMCAFLLQLMDLSGYAKSKGVYYKENHEFSSIWTSFEQLNLFNGKDKFVFMYNDSDIMMDTAFYGYLNGLSQNIFYYARPIDEAMEENIGKIKEEILDGNIDNSAIYIFRNQDVESRLSDALTNAGAKEYYFDDHIIYSK